MGVLAWIAVGFIAGVVARIVVRPGRPLGCLGTIAVGLAGSLVGGTVANVLAGDGFDIAASGIIGSIFGAVLILALARLRNPPERARFGPPPPWGPPGPGGPPRH